MPDTTAASTPSRRGWGRRSGGRWCRSTTRPGWRSCRGAPRRRRRAVSNHRGGCRRRGVPVTAVEELTGFPECLDGRVKTLHPRVHAGMLADLRPRPTARSSPSSGSSRSTGGGQPLPVHRDGDVRRLADECVEQIDIGGPSMVRAAAKNHPSVAVVPRRRATPRCSRARRAVASPSSSASASPPRRSRTPRPTTSRWRPGSATCCADTRRHRLPGLGGRDLGAPAVLRYGENPHQPAALYHDGSPPVGWPRPNSCTARRCPTTTTSTPTPRGERRTTSTSPPSRSSSTPTRVASPSAPMSPRRTASARVRPGLGVRRRHRGQPTVSVAMAEQVAEVFTEVVVAPEYDEAPSRCSRARRTSACCVSRPTHRGRVEYRPVCGGLLMQSVDRARAGGDDPTAWTLATGEPAPRRWPTSRSPGGPAGR